MPGGPASARALAHRPGNHRGRGLRRVRRTDSSSVTAAARRSPAGAEAPVRFYASLAKKLHAGRHPRLPGHHGFARRRAFWRSCPMWTCPV
jgi:hypothetical protein